jgi:uncharacterized protein (DUF3084 family)
MRVETRLLSVLALAVLMVFVTACASSADLETTQQQLASAQDDLAVTRQDLAQARQDLTAATGRLTALEGEATAAQGSLDTLSSGQNALKQSVATAQGDISSAKKDLDSTSRRVDTLNTTSSLARERAVALGRLSIIADLYEEFGSLSTETQQRATLQAISVSVGKTKDIDLVAKWSAVSTVLYGALDGRFSTGQDFFANLDPVQETFLAALQDRLLGALDALAATQ